MAEWGAGSEFLSRLKCVPKICLCGPRLVYGSLEKLLSAPCGVVFFNCSFKLPAFQITSKSSVGYVRLGELGVQFSGICDQYYSVLARVHAAV